jgi:hypothetical protein
VLTAAERRLRASIAAHTKHGLHDPRQSTEPARAAWNQSFVAKALEGAARSGEVLTDQELARRAESLRRAHMKRLALLSARSRRRKAGGAS